jgi:hypothetical protein
MTKKESVATLKWIEGVPIEPGPYLLHLKYERGYTESEVANLDKNKITGQLFFTAYPFEELDNKFFKVIKYCPIPEPID